MVDQHVEEVTADSMIVTPEHPKREESNEFSRNKRQLKKDKIPCWICDRGNDLQVHHMVEWSLSGLANIKKVEKLFRYEWDIHGYGKKLIHEPIISTEDIRCLMVLCQECHTGLNSIEDNPTGIHNLVFPYWIMQKLAIKEAIPVPQEGMTLEDTEEAVDKVT